MYATDITVPQQNYFPFWFSENVFRNWNLFPALDLLFLNLSRITQSGRGIPAIFEPASR